MISVAAPLDLVPMFVRGGAMIPTVPPQNYIGERLNDQVTFNVYPDDKGTASAELYEDDGLSPAYKRGEFRRTKVSVRRGLRGYVVSVSAAEGTYQPGPRKVNFVLKSLPRNPSVAAVLDDRARELVIR
jgi:alpha-glucosidase